MNALFYGFQFAHHGGFSAFSALSREFEKLGVPVCRSPFPNTPAWWPKRIRGVINTKSFQLNEYRLRSAFNAGKLVHYFFPENSLFKAPAWKKNGRLVLSCHLPVETINIRKKTNDKPQFLEGLRGADCVVLMASHEIDAYRAHVPFGNVICIPHGVDTDFFSPDSDRADLEQKNRFKILTVGNCLRDYSVWAETVRRVSPRLKEAEFTVIANPCTLAEARSKLQGTAASVRFLHGISDEALRDEYRRADLVFLPLEDAWANNTLLEGMSCGRPFVVTDLPATREYAGDAACFIEKGNPDVAAEMILQLYAKPEVRSELGRKARQRMESQFTWRIVAKQYMDLYNQLLK
jgi:glycosyltransferase involved in cell wall biosynthesis